MKIITFERIREFTKLLFTVEFSVSITALLNSLFFFFNQFSIFYQILHSTDKLNY